MATKSLTANVVHKTPINNRNVSAMSAPLLVSLADGIDASYAPVSTASGYWNAASGGSAVSTSRSTNTLYWRTTIQSIKAGAVLTLSAGPHGTPRDGYYTDMTVVNAGPYAVDSANGARVRMYGDGVPNKTIDLTFTQNIDTPFDIVVAINAYNYIYSMDKYGTGCTNYIKCNSNPVAAAYLALHW